MKTMSYVESSVVWPGWIGKQRVRFIMQSYSAEEVAMLARLADFDPFFIAEKLSFFQDVLAGTNPTARINRAVGWTVFELTGRDLSDQWKALGKKLCEGKDFDD